MTRIIAQNNTRYRTTGTYADNGKNGLCEKTGSFVDVWASSRPRRVGDRVEVLEPLPFIPDWPGHRPEQYLAKAPFTSKKGDLVALRDSNNEWLIYWPISGSTFRTSKDAYLISRANPEHDAEDTP